MNHPKTLKNTKFVGTVTHYYGHPHVAIVKFTEDLPRDARIRFLGAHTDLEEVADSLEYDHRPVNIAKAGEEIGVRVATRVRRGDRVYTVPLP